MAMVGVALVLYGLIKFISWTITSSGRKISRNKNTKTLQLRLISSS